ncbi:MAG: CopG family transcriptional regulator [Halobacteriota archaeon]|nr:CopG family transcriptional regulator [Halobacteriota archaeon]
MSEKEGKNDKKAVFLPSELYDMVENRIGDLEFGTVDEYVEFVITEILRDDDDDEVTFSEEEEEEVKKRLKALGYLD